MHVSLAATNAAVALSDPGALPAGARSRMHVLKACRRCRDACLRLAQVGEVDGAPSDLARTLRTASRLAEILAKYASHRVEAQRLSPIVSRACEKAARECTRCGDDLRLRECAGACSECADALRLLARPGGA